MSREAGGVVGLQVLHCDIMFQDLPARSVGNIKSVYINSTLLQYLFGSKYGTYAPLRLAGACHRGFTHGVSPVNASPGVSVPSGSSVFSTASSSFTEGQGVMAVLVCLRDECQPLFDRLLAI